MIALALSLLPDMREFSSNKRLCLDASPLLETAKSICDRD